MHTKKSCTALLIQAFNPLKSLSSTWRVKVNSLIPVSHWRRVLVYFRSEVMQAERVQVQQWACVPKDSAVAKAKCLLSEIRANTAFPTVALGVNGSTHTACLWARRDSHSQWLHSAANPILQMPTGFMLPDQPVLLHTSDTAVSF